MDIAKFLLSDMRKQHSTYQNLSGGVCSLQNPEVHVRVLNRRLKVAILLPNHSFIFQLYKSQVFDQPKGRSLRTYLKFRNMACTNLEMQYKTDFKKIKTVTGK